MKKLIVSLLTAMIVAGVQAASVIWTTGTTGASPQLLDNGGTPLVPNQGWAMLVYCGADGFGGFTTSGGLTGNDKIADVNYIGTGVANSTRQPGHISDAQNVSTMVAGDQYVVIFFTGPGGSFTPPANTTIIDTSVGLGGITYPGSGYFGVTAAYTVSAAEAGAGVGNFNLSTTSALTPVPEPATMALALVGAGAMALRRRFQKKA